MKNLILFDIDKEDKENWVTYNSYNYQIEVKKFITIEQINEIVNAVLREGDMIKRRILYIAMLTEFATNIDMEQFKDENDLVDAGKVYDALAENAILDFDTMIVNVDDIRFIIKETESVYSVALALAQSIDQSMNKVNTSELMSAMNTLQGMAKSDNKVINFNNKK